MSRGKKEEIVEKSESEEKPEVNDRYHRFNVKLGAGAFKEVYKAFDTRDQVDVAWNSIDLSLIHTQDERDKIFKECKMLNRLQHPNILKITNQWYNQKLDKLCFITNIVHDGSLAKFFKKRQVNLLRVKQICIQILSALSYLHQQGVIHRDLKCDNIFIEGNTGKVVLGDLGLSCSIVSARSIVGTPHWMAPETYKEKYNQLADIWSFGMCVLELITSRIPYEEHKGPYQLYLNISQGKKPESLSKINSPYVRDFIHFCLETDARKRPSAMELLEHPFLLSKPSDTLLCSELMKEKRKPPPRNEDDGSWGELRGRDGRDGRDHNHRDDGRDGNHEHFRVNPSGTPGPPMISPNSITPSVSSRNHPSRRPGVSIKGVKKLNEETMRIKLQIMAPKLGPKPLNVEFDFRNTEEKPSEVAKEMTRDLELPSKFTKMVESAIRKAIRQCEAGDNNDDGVSEGIKSTAKEVQQSKHKTSKPSKSKSKPAVKSKSSKQDENTMDRIGTHKSNIKPSVSAPQSIAMSKKEERDRHKKKKKMMTLEASQTLSLAETQSRGTLEADFKMADTLQSIQREKTSEAPEGMNVSLALQPSTILMSQSLMNQSETSLTPDVNHMMSPPQASPQQPLQQQNEVTVHTVHSNMNGHVVSSVQQQQHQHQQHLQQHRAPPQQQHTQSMQHSVSRQHSQYQHPHHSSHPNHPAQETSPLATASNNNMPVASKTSSNSPPGTKSAARDPMYGKPLSHNDFFQFNQHNQQQPGSGAGPSNNLEASFDITTTEILTSPESQIIGHNGHNNRNGHSGMGMGGMTRSQTHGPRGGGAGFNGHIVRSKTSNNMDRDTMSVSIPPSTVMETNHSFPSRGNTFPPLGTAVLDSHSPPLDEDVDYTSSVGTMPLPNSIQDVQSMQYGVSRSAAPPPPGPMQQAQSLGNILYNNDNNYVDSGVVQKSQTLPTTFPGRYASEANIVGNGHISNGHISNGNLNSNLSKNHLQTAHNGHFSDQLSPMIQNIPDQHSQHTRQRGHSVPQNAATHLSTAQMNGVLHPSTSSANNLNSNLNSNLPSTGLEQTSSAQSGVSGLSTSISTMNGTMSTMNAHASHQSATSSASQQLPPVPDSNVISKVPIATQHHLSANEAGNAISPPKSTTPPTPPVVVPGLTEIGPGQQKITEAVYTAFPNEMQQQNGMQNGLQNGLQNGVQNALPHQQHQQRQGAQPNGLSNGLPQNGFYSENTGMAQPTYQYTNPRSRSTSPGPRIDPTMFNNNKTRPDSPFKRPESAHSLKSNKSNKTVSPRSTIPNGTSRVTSYADVVQTVIEEPVHEEETVMISESLLALEALTPNTKEPHIYKLCLKLTEQELYGEFTRRNKPYQQNQMKSALARQLSTIIFQELKSNKRKRSGTASPTFRDMRDMNRELSVPKGRKEATPDSQNSMISEMSRSVPPVMDSIVKQSSMTNSVGNGVNGVNGVVGNGMNGINSIGNGVNGMNGINPVGNGVGGANHPYFDAPASQIMPLMSCDSGNSAQSYHEYMTQPISQPAAYSNPGPGPTSHPVHPSAYIRSIPRQSSRDTMSNQEKRASQVNQMISGNAMNAVNAMNGINSMNQMTSHSQLPGWSSAPNQATHSYSANTNATGNNGVGNVSNVNNVNGVGNGVGNGTVHGHVMSTSAGTGNFGAATLGTGHPALQMANTTGHGVGAMANGHSTMSTHNGVAGGPPNGHNGHTGLTNALSNGHAAHTVHGSYPINQISGHSGHPSGYSTGTHSTVVTTGHGGNGYHYHHEPVGSDHTMQSFSTNECVGNDEEGIHYVEESSPPLPRVSALELPFEVEELHLPSASAECHFSEEQISEITAKLMELHREFFDFVKRKYEIIQLRYASTEEQKDGDAQQHEMEKLIRSFDKKREDLTEKWNEWLTDRQQIAMLKNKILRKQRSGSRDEVQNMLDSQLMFEKDPQYKEIMDSRLGDEDKREFTRRFDTFRNKMMQDYREFFVQTIQEFREKERKKAMMNGAHSSIN